MAGIAAKSVLMICCQLHGMNQFSYCHKTQRKLRSPNSDVKNGVTVRYCESPGSELNLPKGSWIHWTSLNQMDEIFKVWIKKTQKTKNNSPHKPAPNNLFHTCQNINLWFQNSILQKWNLIPKFKKCKKIPLYKHVFSFGLTIAILFIHFIQNAE